MGCVPGGWFGFLLGEASQERQKDEEFLKTKEPLIQVVHLGLRGQKKRKSKKPGKQFAQEIVTSLENQIVQNAAQGRRGEQFEIGILVGFWYPKRSERIVPDEKLPKAKGSVPCTPADNVDDMADKDDKDNEDNKDKETTPYEVILKVSSGVDSQSRFVKCGRSVINSAEQKGTLFWAIWTRYSSEIKFSVMFVARLGGKGESRMLQESNYGYDFVVQIVQLKKKLSNKNVLDDPNAKAAVVKPGEKETDDRIVRTFCYLNWKPHRFLIERDPYFVEARRAVDHIGRVYRCRRLVDYDASWNLVSDPVSCCESSCYLSPGSHMLQFDNTVLVHQARISQAVPGRPGSDTPVIEFVTNRGPYTPFEGEYRRLRTPRAKKAMQNPLTNIADHVSEHTLDGSDDDVSVVQEVDERQEDDETEVDEVGGEIDESLVTTDGDIGDSV